MGKDTPFLYFSLAYFMGKPTLACLKLPSNKRYVKKTWKIIVSGLGCSRQQHRPETMIFHTSFILRFLDAY
jgi:hypothetical protein